MNVFLSWSGEISKKEAEIFDWFIRKVLNNMEIKTFYSPNIHKGDLWDKEIFQGIEASSYGFIFVTKENYNSPWLNYEAGAMDAGVVRENKNRIIPIVLDNEAMEKIIKLSPLGRFQCFNLESFIETHSDNDKLFEIFEDILDSMGRDNYHFVENVKETYNDYLPKFVDRLKELQVQDNSIEFEKSTELKPNEVQPIALKEYLNFKNMLRFWITQTNNNIKNVNGSRVRFKQIDYDRSKQAQKEFVNPQFKPEYLTFSKDISLIINFFASGQYKGKNVNFLTARGEKLKTFFLNIVYLVDEDQLWIAYRDDQNYNHDADKLRHTMVQKEYTIGKFFDIKALGLERQDETVSNQLRKAFDYFYKMVRASQN